MGSPTANRFLSAKYYLAIFKWVWERVWKWERDREREIVNATRDTELTVLLSNVELISLSLMSVSILTCREIMKDITGSGWLSQEPFLHTFYLSHTALIFNLFNNTKQNIWLQFSPESDPKSVLCGSHCTEVFEQNLPWFNGSLDPRSQTMAIITISLISNLLQ